MDIKWKYLLPLQDERVFREIESEYGIAFPSDLKELILCANGASPSKDIFTVEGAERVFGAVLSFNRGQPDCALDMLGFGKEINGIPFGIDPAGNVICYDLNTHQITFWDHETNNLISTGKSLTQFIESLH